VQSAQCNPIRYALSGVYVHCNSTARDTSGTHVEYFRDNFGVNVSSEFNAFFVEWIGKSGGEADYELTGYYPNPFESSLTVEYETELAGKMDIFLFPAGSGNDILLSSEYVLQPGSYQEVLSTSAVPTGTYFLVSSLDGVIISRTTLKI